ncbi:MAG: hypothetical protein A2Y18_08270 [Clostridiales bacterium GWD2_32_19]|nr:MAG: hypothetical protein A2Y18_08270 [Clostridiales bacterium GWD2_32_19]
MPYEVGKKYHGFILKEEREVKDISSVCRLFEHEKTGARLLYISNEDENKVFSITFRTPPSDNKGIPHILEHSVLCGSRKFPTREPFVELLKSSQKTFLNASTYPDKTMYPVASMNNKDLQNLMDVYLDAVFYPNIYKKEEIFLQEGWHYELKDNNDDLIYKGVVYNEMKGILSDPVETIVQKSFKHMYPNTCYSNESGGNPEEIVKLKYEDFLEFHKKYYHPSNSYIYMYGNGDIDTYLSFIDREYLNDFEKKEIESRIKLQHSFEAMREYESEYPISKDEDEKDKSYFALSFVAGNALNRELALAIEILGDVLMGNNSSPLKKTLLESGIAKDFALDAGNDPTLQPSINIYAFEADNKKKELFKKIVFDRLEKLITEKIDPELIQGTINKKEFILREANAGSYPKGYIYNIEVMKTWLYDGNPIDAIEYGKQLDIMKIKFVEGYFENIIRTYILNNTHAIYVTLKPKKGLSEKKIKNEKMELKKIKKSMNKDQINELVEKTIKLIEIQGTEDTKENLEKIPRLGIADVKKEDTWIDLESKETEGIRTLYYSESTNKIMYTTLIFDLKTVDKEMIKYITLFRIALGELSTVNYKYDDLAKMIDKNIGGFKIITRNIVEFNKPEHYEPQLVIAIKGLTSKSKEMFEILSEIMQNTKFDDDNKTHEIIKMLRSNIKSAISMDGIEAAADKLTASFMESSRYNEFAAGFDFYNFLIDLDDNFDKKKEEIKTNLQKLKEIIFNKKYMYMLVVCDKDDYSTFEENIKVVIENIGTKELDKKEYVFDEESKKLGLTTQSDGQYVAKGYRYDKLGYEYSGKQMVLKKILGLDYLWNEVRVKGGAYGSTVLGSSLGNLIMVSWQDPNLKETLDIYDNAYKYLENLDIDMTEIEKYIVSIIGALDPPFSTPYHKAYTFEYKMSSGITKELQQKFRDDVLDTKIEDIKNFSKMLKEIMEHGHICVLGSEGKIKENKDIFDKIERVK